MTRFRHLMEIIEDSTFINIVRSGFVGAVPFLLLGSFSLLIISFPINTYQSFIQSVAGGTVYSVFNTVFNYTLNSVSLILLITMSYYYGKYSMSPERHLFPVIAITSYLTFIGVGIQPDKISASIFSPTWTLTAIIIGLGSSALFEVALKFSLKKHENEIYRSSRNTIKFVYLVFPAAVTIMFFAVLNIILSKVLGTVEANSFFTDISNRIFDGLGREMISGFLFVLMVHFLWMFGIHGSNVLHSVSTTLFADGNGTIFQKTFFDAFVLMGGSGTCICLLIALLIGAKGKGSKRLAKFSILPVAFNISETLVYGLPVIFNPILFVPFIITPLVMFLISAGATYIGLVPIVQNSINWTTPVVMSGIMATGSVMGGLLQIFNITVGVLIYLPFVKFLDKPGASISMENLEELTEYVKYMEETGLAVKLTRGNAVINKNARKLLEDIHFAFEMDEMALYYQPQVDKDHRVMGAEGLLRWQHPTCGFIYPPLILYLAIEDDFLDELEMSILKMACRDISELNRRGYENLKISINISAMQLEEENFFDRVNAVISNYDFGTNKLALEITERVALSDRQVVRNAINNLEARGIDVIMDDFGMGNSSMTYLQESKFAYVKIDGKLIKDITVNDRSRNIVEVICELSESLGFKVIAEYVETQEQRDILLGLGCEIYQGYLYGKAMPLDEFMEKLN